MTTETWRTERARREVAAHLRAFRGTLGAAAMCAAADSPESFNLAVLLDRGPRLLAALERALKAADADLCPPCGERIRAVVAAELLGETPAGERESR